MKALFEKSLYERIVDFYIKEEVATGKKVTHILLEGQEWEDFKNDKTLMARCVPVGIREYDNGTVLEGYEITLPNRKRANVRVTVMEYVEGRDYHD